METCPYRVLMGHKNWATNGLYDTIARNLDRIPEADRILLARILDHVQAVDEIFACNLAGRAHGRTAPRSEVVPPLEQLAADSRAFGAWYAEDAVALARRAPGERLVFRHSSGDEARMTRGEMLLHVAIHGAYHRGNAGLLLLRNGIEPNPDRITDFLEQAADAAEGAR